MNIIDEKEEKLSKEIERSYFENRKNIILDGVKNHERSIEYFRSSLFLLSYFVCTSIFNILYTLGNPGVELYNSPLLVSNIVSGVGALVINSVSKVYKKAAKRVFREIEETDTFFRLKDYYNSSEVKKVIEISNPKLFEVISNSKLYQPIDLAIFNEMTSVDKRHAFDIAYAKKMNDENIEEVKSDNEIEYIDLLEVEDSTIPYETKVRKMYLK